MVIHLLTKQGEIKTKINHHPFMNCVTHTTVCITQLYKQNNSNSDLHWELAHTTYFFTCQQPSPQVIQKIGLIILQVEFTWTMITIEKAVSMSHKWLYIEGFIQCKGQFLNKLDIMWKYLDHFLWITCLCYTDIECHPPFKNTITYTFYSCNIQLSFCITTPCKRKWLQK